MYKRRLFPQLSFEQGVAEKRVGKQSTWVERKPDNRMSSALSQAKSHLHRLNIRAVKGLGQHFLIDRRVLETIISAAELGPGDTVIEIGPGLGVLTGELLKRARKVIAVEVDSRLATALGERFSSATQLTVLNANILDLDPDELVTGQTHTTNRFLDYKVVANLPYYIASPILRHFLEASRKPVLMVIMVQKEVGQSMIAEPGYMSLLSISVQLYGKPTIVDHVPSRSFYPQPKVDSAIMRIDVYPKPFIEMADVTGFFEVVKAGFSTPRKQLRNALAVGLQLPPPTIVQFLEQAGIAPQRRPQTLSLEEWAEVYRAFASRDKR